MKKKIILLVITFILLSSNVAAEENNQLKFFGYDSVKFDKDKKEYQLTVKNNVSMFGIIYADKENINELEEFSDYLLVTFNNTDDTNNIKDSDFIINGVSINNDNKKFSERVDYVYASQDALEKECNDDETECYYYEDSKLVQYVKNDDDLNICTIMYYENGKICQYIEAKSKTAAIIVASIYEDLKVGDNTLEYVVTSTTGEKNTYTYKIYREDNTSNDDSENNDNTGGNTNISDDESTTGGKPSQEDVDKNKDNDVDKSPDTGSILIFIAWTIGLGALGYSIYWFQKRREEL